MMCGHSSRHAAFIAADDLLFGEDGVAEELEVALGMDEKVLVMFQICARVQAG